MGNRIYGCDDCQLTCPWNKFARRAVVPDFDVRPDLADPTLLQLWRWDEVTFLRQTEGSAIRRIGFARWQRNLAGAMGNVLAGRVGGEGTTDDAGQAATLRAAIRSALQAWLAAPPDLGALNPAHGEMGAEHVRWALAQQVAARG
jgi:epoxyqueuosine reductase